jgi:hypothetical protein
MRLTKMLAALALTILVALVSAGLPGYRAGVAWAQLPPTNPLAVPQAAPSAPTQLAPPITVQELPALVSVRPLPGAAPTLRARVFNCSCFGAARPTHWMGRVKAPSYFAARQAATGACMAFNREPQSPFMQPGPLQLAPSTTLPQGFQSPNAAASLRSSLPGTLSFSTTNQLKNCTACTCD